MGISTHILDTSQGRPAADVAVTLERWQSGDWVQVGEGQTNGDGRVGALVEGEALREAAHRITFGVGAYFARQGVDAFYPKVQIEFMVADAQQHYHVPLLLNPYGYSTYRGS